MKLVPPKYSHIPDKNRGWGKHITKHCNDILLTTTKKMQRYTIFFIIVDALHVSGGFSAHHQELKNCTHIIWYVPGLLLLPLAWLGWN
jgi:hypothetical protein